MFPIAPVIAVRACTNIRSRQPGPGEDFFCCKFHAIQHFGGAAIVAVGRV
jgi:hypothetical protein